MANSYPCCCCNCVFCDPVRSPPTTLYFTIDTAVSYVGDCEAACDMFNATFELSYTGCSTDPLPPFAKVLTWEGEGPNFCDPDEPSELTLTISCTESDITFEVRIQSENIASFILLNMTSNAGTYNVENIDDYCNSSFSIQHWLYPNLVSPFYITRGGCRFGYYIGGEVKGIVSTSPP